MLVVVELALGRAEGRNVLLGGFALCCAGGNNSLLIGLALGHASGNDDIFLAVCLNGGGSRLVGGGGLEAGLVSRNGLESCGTNSFISNRPCQRNDRILRTYVFVTSAIVVVKSK